MATFNVEGIDELIEAFDSASKVPEEVKKIALKSMGGILEDAIRNEGRAKGVRDPESTTHVLDSITLNEPEITDDGGSIYVTFKGKRRDSKHKKPTRNAEIAFLNEFGVPERNIEPTNFIRDAVEKNADKVNEAGAKIIFTWQEKIL